MDVEHLFLLFEVLRRLGLLVASFGTSHNAVTQSGIVIRYNAVYEPMPRLYSSLLFF